MFVRVFILILLLVPLPGAAESIVSQSEQFVIYYGKRHVSLDPVPADSVLLEPELLAITAERVKQALAAEVPALGRAREKINLHILDESTPQGAIGIVSTLFTDGWNYRVAIPPVADQTRLVKALIQVILVEYANRSGQRGAEIPAWVVEGLAQELFHSVGPKLVVDRHSTAWEGALRDLQKRTRETMRTNAPPSFNDLTTLAPPPKDAPAEPLYQSSAHLLVRSLLSAPGGRQKFAGFVQLLPHSWNWQTSFRQAFGFESMLDVEKWWSLVTVEFTSRDLRQTWTASASLQKLDELLSTRVEVRSATNSLPETRVMDLPSLLREKDLSFQNAALNEKIAQLGYTAPHLSQQVGLLALDYKKVLENYLYRRRQGTVRPGLRTTPEVFYQNMVDDALRAVAELDVKRRTLAEPTVSAR